MEFGKLLNGQELILKQTNCIKDLPSKGLKEFSPKNSWLEKKQIENQLEEKYNFIKAERIEKNNNLSQAEWIPNLKKAKVTRKIGKPWETLGHHQDNEDWLLPEEVLFLIENGELQLFCDTVSISVEDCYELVFNQGGCSLDEYRVFSHLSRAGLKVLRHSPSVSVTNYEKQVRLDSIVQNQRRLPPEVPTDEVTIIDDDISIVETFEVTKGSKPKHNSILQVSSEPETVVLIESDEEEINELDVDSDSDIICISSPSYTSERNSREWYPKKEKCLSITMEKLIDLCDDENDVSDSKCNIRNIIDLIRASKQEIIHGFPSVRGSITSVVVADKRLLPPHITPKYSEYRINLNIRSDDTYHHSFNGRSEDNFTNYGPPSLPPSTMGFNGHNSFSFSNYGLNQVSDNPLLLKAQQMQAMAMNMIQTAANLMSIMNAANHNPNELWELCSNRAPYYPRFGPVNHVRHFGPRRPRPFNNRFQRRHVPYERRFRPIRPFYHSSSNSPERHNHSPISTEVVILSDDSDDSDKNSDTDHCLEADMKRKKNENFELNKRLKIELDNDGEVTTLSDSSCVLESISENLKKEPGGKIKEEIKVENKNSNCALKEEKDITDAQIGTNSSYPEHLNVSLKSENPQNSEESKENLTVTNKNIGNTESNKNVNKTKDTCKENLEERSTNQLEQSIVIGQSESAQVLNANEARVSIRDDIPDNTANLPKEIEIPSLETTNTNEQNEKISSWEQYKNMPNDFEDDDSLIKFDQCTSYSNVLSSLKIFKPIDVRRVNKRFKISFDVYLPDSNFKKSLKVLPNYRVIVLKPSDEPPTSLDLEGLKTQYQDNIPFLFSVVFDETLGFYLYNTISLTTHD